MSNILEYKPNLDTKKKILSTIEKQNAVSTDIQSELYAPSATLEQLSYSLPSGTLNTMNVVIGKSQAILDKLENGIKDLILGGISFFQYKEAIQRNDMDTIDAFEEPNASDINGDHKVELFYLLSKTTEDLNDFKDFFEKQNYGKNIDPQEAAKIDQTNLEKMTSHEMDKNTSKINYSAVFLDVQINNISNLLLQSASDNLDTIGFLVDHLETSTAMESSSLPSENSPVITVLMKKVFKENVDITMKDKVKLRQALMGSAKQETISQAYDQRREFLELMQGVESLASMPDSMLKTKMVNSLNLLYNSVSDTILDMYKSTQMEALYVSDYISTVGDKQHTRYSYKSYQK